jgi:hypothetical protein
MALGEKRDFAAMIVSPAANAGADIPPRHAGQVHKLQGYSMTKRFLILFMHCRLTTSKQLQCQRKHTRHWNNC